MAGIQSDPHIVIHIESRRKKLETIQKAHPGATIIDVTSKGEEPWLKFSPFYPHGDIPIPGTDKTGQSVEGIWQGLKVFENEGVDPTKWAITNMKGIKRSGTSRGKVLGHQCGDTLLGYLDARKQIYIPAYNVVLRTKLLAEIQQLHAMNGDIVLLDYETNANPENLSKPLSHASLIANCVNSVRTFYRVLSVETVVDPDTGKMKRNPHSTYDRWNRLEYKSTHSAIPPEWDSTWKNNKRHREDYNLLCGDGLHTEKALDEFLNHGPSSNKVSAGELDGTCAFETRDQAWAYALGDEENPTYREALSQSYIVEFPGIDLGIIIPEDLKGGVQVQVIGPGVVINAIPYAEQHELQLPAEYQGGEMDLPFDGGTYGDHS